MSDIKFEIQQRLASRAWLKAVLFDRRVPLKNKFLFGDIYSCSTERDGKIDTDFLFFNPIDCYYCAEEIIIMQ